jgi:hypothetical protein
VFISAQIIVRISERCIHFADIVPKRNLDIVESKEERAMPPTGGQVR